MLVKCLLISVSRTREFEAEDVSCLPVSALLDQTWQCTVIKSCQLYSSLPPRDVYYLYSLFLLPGLFVTEY